MDRRAAGLLGNLGDNTTSNTQAANRVFWRQTVLPFVWRKAKALSAWLAPAYGTPLQLRPDLDAVDAVDGAGSGVGAGRGGDVFDHQ